MRGIQILLTFLLLSPVAGVQPYFLWNFDSTSCLSGEFDTEAKDNLTFAIKTPGHCRKDLGFSYSGDTRSDLLLLPQNASEHVFSHIRSSSNDGFAISMWVKPNITNDTYQYPLIRIGRSDPNATQHHYCGTDGVDFMVTQFGPHLGILLHSYADEDPIWWPCTKIYVPDIMKHNELIHIYISLNSTSLSVFANGEKVLESREVFILNSFSYSQRAESIGLLAHGQDELYRSWQGSIFQFAVYPPLKENSDVKTILARGIQPSIPIPTTASTRVNEDAETEAGSHSVEWYKERPSPAESGTIGLSSEYLDLELEQLLKAANTTISRPVVVGSIYFYLESLPLKGSIHGLDGSALNKGSTIPNNTTTMAQVVYLPPLHAHSELPRHHFDSFVYCVSTEPIYSSESCISSTVSIEIIPVNDPPIAYPVRQQTLIETNDWDTFQPIHLSGYDVDERDRVVKVRISKYPSYGRLLTSVTSFRTDGVQDATPLLSLNSTIEHADPVFVKYVWDPLSFDDILPAEGAVDDFEFQVADSNDVWSTPEKVQMRILPASKVLNQPETLLSCSAAGSFCVFHFSVDDFSGMKRPVGIQVDTLPPESTGYLIDTVTRSRLKHDSTLSPIPFPYNDTIPIGFVPQLERCRGKGGFTTDFRVRSFTGDRDNFNSISNSRQYKVEVICPKRDVELALATNQTLTVDATNFLDDYQVECAGSPFNFTYTCEKFLSLGRIDRLDDGDDKARVQVNVSSRKGYLSIHEQARPIVDPVDGRFEVNTRGFSIFVARKDLGTVLSSIEYQTFLAGTDTVKIQVDDGDCESDTECEFLTVELMLEAHRVEEKEGTATAKNHNGIPWGIFGCAFGYPALYYLFFQASVYYRRSK